MLIWSMYKETETMNERGFEKQTMDAWEWGCQQCRQGVRKRKISIRSNTLQELGSCWVSKWVTDWAIQYASKSIKGAIEQERGGMFILLALCFLSVSALSVGDCWQGLWSELQFLGEHILCSSLRSLKHKHTSQHLQSTLLTSPFCLL